MGAKSLKILCCLLLIFTLTVAQPKEQMQEAEAVVPLAGWVVSIIGGIVIDIAIDMGVKFIDKKAKEGFQNKVLQKIFSKNTNKIKINELKPTKSNAGKWILKAPKWLLALITGAVTNEIIETKKEDIEREEIITSGKPLLPSPNDSDIVFKPTDPFYNTNVHITGLVYMDGSSNVESRKRFAYLNSWVHWRMSPVSFAERSKIEISAYKDFSLVDTFYVRGGFNGEFKYGTRWDSPRFYTDTATFYSVPSGGSVVTEKYMYAVDNVWAGFPAFKVYLEELENNSKKIYYANGLLVSEYDGLIQLPDVIPDDFDYSLLPPTIQNDREYEFTIKDESLLINENWTTINEGDIFNWEIIEGDIINQGDTIYNITIIYDYNPSPNPDYVVTPEEQDKIDSQLPSTDGSKPPSTNVGTIDGSLVAYVKNAYEYATSLINTSVEGLKSLATGAKELTALFGVFMGWLPKEIVVLMTSGLGLMIGLRVFRR